MLMFSVDPLDYYHQCTQLKPNLPTAINAIDLQDEWTATTAYEIFLLVNDGDQDKILIFATNLNLQLLVDNDTIYADGTFYTCPSLFTQLCTLHDMVDGGMLPLVFALLPGKSEQLYTRYFHLLKEPCTQRQMALQPTTLFIGYETAVQNAARTSFPGITIKGCFFHYTQCIWRKVQNTSVPILNFPPHVMILLYSIVWGERLVDDIGGIVDHHC